MEIIKIIGIGLIALIIILTLKQYRPEYAIYVSLFAGAIILFLVMDKLTGILTVLTNLANKANVNGKFFSILLKITGIAIITEYAVSVCKDAGESAIANKIDVGGKIIVIGLSIPIISSLLELILQLLP